MARTVLGPGAQVTDTSGEAHAWNRFCRNFRAASDNGGAIMTSHTSEPLLDDSGRIDTRRFYLRSRTVLRPALAGRLGSIDAAEDVLHDAFVRFLKAYEGKSITNPLGLLARIALNIVRDSARSEGFRRRQIEWLDEPVCAVPPLPDPEEAYSSHQWLSQVRLAIDRLPPRCREVFLLHRVEGLPQSEVAAILGISRSAVEKNLVRAHARLKDDLAAVDSARAGGA